MADLIGPLMAGLGSLMNQLLMLSIIFALIGIGFWAVQYLAPKARSANIGVFRGGGSRRRRSRRRYY